jgi:D-alanyl-lipoteichoic acid acyltransferase DltB (MBOAT superfamily)
MLFNSYEFLLVFLPAVLLLHHVLTRRGSRTLAVAALVAASIVFYVSWRWQLSWAVAASIAFNLLWSRLIGRSARPAVRRALLLTGIAANVAWLAMFKVAAWPECDRLIVCGGFRSAEDILIPLGISFITFQQIIFLVDTAKNRVEAPTALEHLFMVIFFPHLIMGPLVHARSLLPQLRAPAFMSPTARNLAVGLTIFSIGLFKKVVIADSLGAYVNVVFAAVASGGAVTVIDAWSAAAAFPIQLYFDFSGYADMAVGLARMFGIAIPFGFNSPLKAVDRLDLWRRWNTTLNEFFRTYVFLPLCRAGMPHALALLLTGMISGLWHGFGPTFILWSVALTAFMLASHWLKQSKHFNYSRASNRPWYRGSHVALTFFVTMLLGVMFRAPSVAAAQNMYAAMAGAGGFGLGEAAWTTLAGYFPALGILADPHALPSPPRYLSGIEAGFLLACAVMVWAMPNTQTLLAPALRKGALSQPVPDDTGMLANKLSFDRGAAWAAAVGLMLFLSLMLIERSGRFVYMQF